MRSARGSARCVRGRAARHPSSELSPRNPSRARRAWANASCTASRALSRFPVTDASHHLEMPMTAPYKSSRSDSRPPMFVRGDRGQSFIEPALSSRVDHDRAINNCPRSGATPGPPDPRKVTETLGSASPPTLGASRPVSALSRASNLRAVVRLHPGTLAKRPQKRSSCCKGDTEVTCAYVARVGKSTRRRRRVRWLVSAPRLGGRQRCG
jgi:hypothetical protein